MVVEVVRTVDEELVEAMARLIPQLSPDAEPVTAQTLREVVDSDVTTLLVARRAGQVVGCLTLVVFRIPSGRRCWIEDVVVDAEHRRAGIGEALTRTALDHAATLGEHVVNLTSGPARTDAHRLYERLGFTRRETSVFRLTP